TFIVRSGLLTSVHAFATDPTRGVFVLMLLGIAVSGALLLFAIRAPAMEGGSGFAPVSREGALLLNNLLLATAAGTVLIGTLYPLVLEAITGEKVSVGPPYFNSTFVPLMLPMLGLMAVGPLLAWRQADALRAVKQLWLAAIAAAIVVAVAIWIGGAGVAGVIGLGVAAWLAVGSFYGWVRRWWGPGALRRLVGLPAEVHGMTLAHIAAAVIVAGITAASVWQGERVQLMKVGQTAQLSGYSWTLDRVYDTLGPNYEAVRGQMTVRDDDGKTVAVLYPERRFYPDSRQNTTEAAIHTTGLADLYAVIGEGSADEGWAVRLYHNPLVPWMWFGAGLMAFGGLVSASGRVRVRRTRKQTAGAAEASA
ncbi:MAG: heme lyase NrfEFG subunit NrfE, partial [Alphaproteobacteria bacterium]|nr:heme lyase NrfEFG subunit NrfE [Alphaproteobacteria bacterium]